MEKASCLLLVLVALFSAEVLRADSASLHSRSELWLSMMVIYVLDYPDDNGANKNQKDEKDNIQCGNGGLSISSRTRFNVRITLIIVLVRSK